MTEQCKCGHSYVVHANGGPCLEITALDQLNEIIGALDRASALEYTEDRRTMERECERVWQALAEATELLEIVRADVQVATEYVTTMPYKVKGSDLLDFLGIMLAGLDYGRACEAYKQRVETFKTELPF